jgi:quercetin dioxygenase-like cupin family protein
MSAPVPVLEAIVNASTAESVPAGTNGVRLTTLVSSACGAASLSTGIATFRPAASLPYHAHTFSEAITILEGRARVLIEGRLYRLGPRDCIHVPAGTAHQVENDSESEQLVAHWAFSSGSPTRELIDRCFSIDDRGFDNPSHGEPENIVRYDRNATYELSSNAWFLDLFARRYGSLGICGGHGSFGPSASLPCHIHDFDESITIIGGKAVCLVEGRQYELSNFDTAFIPRGLPHRFLNQSNEDMAMIWVYAGSEPDRRIVQSKYCSGLLVWPGPDSPDTLQLRQNEQA